MRVSLVLILSVFLIATISLSTFQAVEGSLNLNIVREGTTTAVVPGTSIAISCTQYGNPSHWRELTFGTRAQCVAVGNGAYRFRATVDAFSCRALPVSTSPFVSIPRNPSAITSARIQFCGDAGCTRRDAFCDTVNPNIPVITPQPGWYRSPVSTTATYTDARRIFQMIWQHQSTSGTSLWSSPVTCSNADAGNPFTTGTPPQSCTQTISVQTGSAPCTVTGTNACTLNVRGIDFAGQQSAIGSMSFNVDLVAPTSSFTWSRGADYATGGNWYRNSDRPDYTVTCTDAHSGCRQINTRTCSGGTTSCVATTRTVSGSLTSQSYAGTTIASCTSQRCDRNVRYFSYDNALPSPGNAGAELDSAILIDGAPPITTISAPSSPNPLTQWVGTGFSVSYACTDTSGGLTGTGCRNIYSHVAAGTSSVCTNQGAYTQHSPSPNPTRNVDCSPGTTCTVTACGYSTDNVLNSEFSDYKHLSFRLDRTSPTVGPRTLTPVSSNPTGSGGFNQVRTPDWYRSSVTVTFTASDADSGINQCHYRMRTSTGSWGSWIAIMSGGSNACAGSPVFGSEVTSRTVSYTAALGTSTQCSAEGTNACVMQIRVIDAVANEQLSPEFSINTDYSAPTNSVLTWNTANYSDARGNWYNTRAGYTLTAQDPMSGIRRNDRSHMQPAGTTLLTRVNEYPGATGASPVTISDIVGNGADSCSDQRCDRFVRFNWNDWGLHFPGNTLATALNSAVVLLDSLPPTTTISSPPQGALQPGTHWVGQNFDYTIGCTDDVGSGCRDVTYSCTIPGSCTSAGTITIPGDTGTFTHVATCAEGSACLFNLTRSSTDNVIHVEPQLTQLYGIDKVDPYVNAAGYQYNPLLRQPTFDNWMNEAFSITVTVHDEHSGIGNCSYRVINGGTAGGWTGLSGNGCSAGNANIVGANVNDDRTRIITIPSITVGAGQQCSVQGRDICEIELEVTDMVGRTITYSETVSIDYTAPSCDIITIVDYTNPYDSSPYSHYNHTERTFYYNPNIAGYSSDPYIALHYPGMTIPIYYNVTIQGNDTNGALSGNQVSGIRTLTFPVITSVGNTYTVDNSSLLPSGDATIWSSLHQYNYNDGASASGIFNVTVEDQAGNRATCAITVLSDTTPPTPTGSLQYDHYVDAASQLTYDPGFNTVIGDDNLSRVRDAFIFVYRAPGIMDSSTNQYTPMCGAFEDHTTIPAADLMDRYVATIAAADSSTASWLPTINETFADRIINGNCHRFFLRVYDNSNNYVDYLESNSRIMAVDGTPNLCTVFGRYDNCNNRASEWLNNNRTTRNSSIQNCPGSCVGGTVELLDSGGSTDPYDNAEVFVESFSDYINTTDGLGQYTIYNIIENDRPHAFTANPSGDERSLYLPRTQTIILSPTRIGGTQNLSEVYDRTDFTFAFDPRSCDDNCVAIGDPFQLCRTECRYQDEFGNNLCGATQLDSDDLARLQYCVDSGASKGWIIDNPADMATQIVCCGVLQGTADPSTVLVDKVLLNGTLEVDAAHVARSERVVSFRGKLVRLVVTVFR